MDKKETHTMPVSRSYIWEMDKERKDEIIKELLSLIQDTLVKEIPTCAPELCVGGWDNHGISDVECLCVAGDYFDPKSALMKRIADWTVESIHSEFEMYDDWAKEAQMDNKPFDENKYIVAFAGESLLLGHFVILWGCLSEKGVANRKQGRQYDGMGGSIIFHNPIEGSSLFRKTLRESFSQKHDASDGEAKR